MLDASYFHTTCWFRSTCCLVEFSLVVGFGLDIIFKRLVGSGADQDNSTLESFAYLAKMCSEFSFDDKKFVKLSTADLHSIRRIFNPFNAN